MPQNPIQILFIIWKVIFCSRNVKLKYNSILIVFSKMELSNFIKRITEHVLLLLQNFEMSFLSCWCPFYVSKLFKATEVTLNSWKIHYQLWLWNQFWSLLRLLITTVTFLSLWLGELQTVNILHICVFQEDYKLFGSNYQAFMNCINILWLAVLSAL